jgi:hypothetical protein
MMRILQEIPDLNQRHLAEKLGMSVGWQNQRHNRQGLGKGADL